MNKMNIEKLMQVKFREKSKALRAIRYALSGKRPARPLYSDRVLAAH